MMDGPISILLDDSFERPLPRTKSQFAAYHAGFDYILLVIAFSNSTLSIYALISPHATSARPTLLQKRPLQVAIGVSMWTGKLQLLFPCLCFRP